MEQKNIQDGKPIKIERLQQAIDEVDEKINKLLARKEALTSELENIQNSEILSIITSKYKTPQELAEFIKRAKNGGFVVELVKQKQVENQIRTEVANETSDN